MITQWRLSNFKSIRGPLDLELAPITVLSGLNSSGKSSVLQSIRLVAQTLRSPSLDRPLVLNGYDVLLGSLASIATTIGHPRERSSGEEGAVSIGFDLETSQSSSFPSDSSQSLRGVADASSVPLSVRLDVEFQGDHRRSLPRALLNHLYPKGTFEVRSSESLFRLTSSQSVTSDDGPPPIRHAKLDYGRLASTDNESLLSSLSPTTPPYLINRRGVNYYANVSSEDVSFALPDSRLALLSHFLPQYVIEPFPVDERRRQQALLLLRLMMILDPGDLPPFNDAGQVGSLTPGRLFETEMPSEIANQIHQVILERHKDAPRISAPTVGSYLTEVKDYIAQMDGPTHNYAMTQAIASELLDYVSPEPKSGDHGSSLEFATNDPLVDAITEAANRTIDFFVRSIRYLGPLRLNPNEAQQFSPASEPDDVGPKGEFAAVVFEANLKHRIRWWNPTTGAEEEGTLEHAVSTWLDYLGIAKHVGVNESPTAGVSWQVRIGDDWASRSLASVGVGVSQLLPILIAGLLAPDGALLLIEQPELHLHPRAQARLSEFFWGLSQTGRRCLIETHSEALINGFRLLMVGSSSSEMPISIYFSHLSEGSSVFDRVLIRDDGLIANWPEGFFDENHLLEDRITSSAIQSRARTH